MGSINDAVSVPVGDEQLPAPRALSDLIEEGSTMMPMRRGIYMSHDWFDLEEGQERPADDRLVLEVSDGSVLVERTCGCFLTMALCAVMGRVPEPHSTEFEEIREFLGMTKIGEYVSPVVGYDITEPHPSVPFQKKPAEWVVEMADDHRYSVEQCVTALRQHGL